MAESGIVFLGPPGAGKGTQAEIIAACLHVPHISTGEILREAIREGTPLGHKAQTYVDQGHLVPNELILELVAERLHHSDAQKGWILDGFPRNVSQASFLDDLLEKRHHPPHQVVNLEVPDKVLIDRLLLRGRKDDNEEVIRNRLVVYYEQTSPLIDYYTKKGNLHSVNGDRTPTEVTLALKEVLMC